MMSRLTQILRGKKIKPLTEIESAVKYAVDNAGSGGGGGEPADVRVVFTEADGSYTASVAIETIYSDYIAHKRVFGVLETSGGVANLELSFASEDFVLFSSINWGEEGFGLGVALGTKRSSGGDHWEYISEATSPFIVEIGNIVWDQTGTSGTAMFSQTPARIAAAYKEKRDVFAVIDIEEEKDGQTERNITRLPLTGIEYSGNQLKRVSFGCVRAGGSINSIYTAILPSDGQPNGTIAVTVLS